jgi:hypothetical protein
MPQSKAAQTQSIYHAKIKSSHTSGHFYSDIIVLRNDKIKLKQGMA